MVHGMTDGFQNASTCLTPHKREQKATRQRVELPINKFESMRQTSGCCEVRHLTHTPKSIDTLRACMRARTRVHSGCEMHASRGPQALQQPCQLDTHRGAPACTAPSYTCNAARCILCTTLWSWSNWSFLRSRYQPLLQIPTTVPLSYPTL